MLYHLIFTGTFAFFGLMWSVIFCVFSAEAYKKHSEGAGAAAVGSLLVTAACLFGMGAYWTHFVAPLLR